MLDSRVTRAWGRSFNGAGGRFGLATAAAPSEIDASLRDLLAPLVAERVRHAGGIAPPDALEIDGVFAAVSAVAAPSGAAASDNSFSMNGEPNSHFTSACRSLAMQGFRRC